MPDENLEKLSKETYLKMIKNSVGSKIFNSLLVKNKTTGKISDVLEDGMYSCAFFVSGILMIFGLIDGTHAMVNTTVKKLKEKGYQEINKNYQPGDILVWEEITFEDGSTNEHMGFYLDENTAVSTSYKEKKVVSHHPTFGLDDHENPIRKIKMAFRVF